MESFLRTTKTVISTWVTRKLFITIWKCTTSQLASTLLIICHSLTIFKRVSCRKNLKSLQTSLKTQTKVQTFADALRWGHQFGSLNLVKTLTRVVVSTSVETYQPSKGSSTTQHKVVRRGHSSSKNISSDHCFTKAENSISGLTWWLQRSTETSKVTGIKTVTWELPARSTIWTTWQTAWSIWPTMQFKNEAQTTDALNLEIKYLTMTSKNTSTLTEANVIS